VFHGDPTLRACYFFIRVCTIEYGSVCFTGVARTHFLDLERLQYRRIKISLGLMRSTPNNSLGMLSGISSLEHRMLYLNYRYLVNTFQKVDHTLRSCLEPLNRLNPKKCLTAFREVADFGTGHEAGFTRHSFEAMVSSPVLNRFGPM
jgi:hypothetical protein